MHLPFDATRGVLVFVIEHLSDPDLLPLAQPAGADEACVHALDHVVIMSKDPEATRRLYGEQLGLRLALDREFPQRRTRLMFFRVGGATVEIGAPMDAPPEPDAEDRLWGLAYQVASVQKAVLRLAAEGLDVSEVRVGRKPGTAVATVRGPTHGVPTLIIGPD